MEPERCEAFIAKNKFYSILPAAVRYDDDLSSSAKIIYTEITALASQKGYCFASNRYFADIFKVSISTVSRWIHQLEEKGYIRCEYLKEGAHVNCRKIYIEQTLCEAFHYLMPPNADSDPSCFCDVTLPENAKDNIIISNTIEAPFQGIYGEAQNIYLSDDEYRKLVRRCGHEQTSILISDLSYHIASTGRKYKSHYYTILSWYRKRVKNAITHPTSWYRHPEDEEESDS
ncbi:helix-turn-helix domain-containing protein [Erysipelotrichaceae bacterium AF15-26LB]|nr:hypothetical protein HMPREF0983_01695 [Erysipelotrichaceae bacterium 3_1_53]MCR0347753.1 helix-turn-helix domain-containing protein [[Clostridium] innocuum]RJV92418.1 helix-turn-helix domain-containing protein [Erysipelotrichaceae bacterium AF15-26LB]RJV92667.1 helix-turn-helix domain-containing protein [Erysipelotrichaceae bacterium AF19-24AC]